MKKCLICKQSLKKEDEFCPNCHSKIDYKYSTSREQKIQFAIKRSFLLCHYKETIRFCDSYIEEYGNDILINLYVALSKYYLSSNIEHLNKYLEEKNYLRTNLKDVTMLLYNYYDKLDHQLLDHFVSNYNLIKYEKPKEDENTIKENLFDSFVIPEIVTTQPDMRKNGLMSVIAGIVIELLIYLIVLLNCKEDVFYPLAILYTVIPSFIIGFGLTKVILKRKLFVLSVVFSLVFLYIISFIITISMHDGSFIETLGTHFERIIKSGYEALEAIQARSKEDAQIL